LGAVVVEISSQSGSLITTRLANEQDEMVWLFQVQSITPQAKGCHKLLRQATTLVESAQDIIFCCYNSLQQILTAVSQTNTPQAHQMPCELLRDTSY